ncbi:MAG: TetR/AcrR family transcriptional regulator [Deltaproteobacteria bacterium]|nr:TetR/AcrR family transcriptional regulator [Deltaproteobacteria bacterium]
MSKSQYHHGDLRKALIQASLDLVEAEGPHEISLREAARRVGVSPGAPYRHFKSRQELMAAVAMEVMARYSALVEEELERVGPGPIEAFRAQGLASVRFAKEHPNLFRLMSSRSYFDSLGPEVIEGAKAKREEILELLREAQRAGLLGTGKPEHALLAGQALAYGLARMLVDGRLALLGHAEDDVVELMMALTKVLGEGLFPREKPLSCS